MTRCARVLECLKSDATLYWPRLNFRFQKNCLKSHCNDIKSQGAGVCTLTYPYVRTEAHIFSPFQVFAHGLQPEKLSTAIPHRTMHGMHPYLAGISDCYLSLGRRGTGSRGR